MTPNSVLLLISFPSFQACLLRDHHCLLPCHLCFNFREVFVSLHLLEFKHRIISYQLFLELKPIISYLVLNKCLLILMMGTQCYSTLHSRTPIKFLSTPHFHGAADKHVTLYLVFKHRESYIPQAFTLNMASHGNICFPFSVLLTACHLQHTLNLIFTPSHSV